MKKISFLLFLLLLCSSAFAFTGNQLENFCTAGENSNEKNLCIMFFKGYVDGLLTGTQIVEWNAPKDMPISPLTIRKIFFKTMQKEPIAGDQPADIIITYSLIQEGILKIKPKLEEERKK